MTSTSTPGQANAHRPAMGLGWMLPCYDPMTAVLGIRTVYHRLLTHATIGPGDRVLDVGCGTGTLAVHTKQAHPEASVIGLDPDATALQRARRKAQKRGLDVQFDVGYGGALPYPDASFDIVLSSFMVHHLVGAERERALTEILRVLTPTGSLHLVDFGRGEDLAGDLRRTGFSTGTVTRGRTPFGAAVTLIDTRP